MWSVRVSVLWLRRRIDGWMVSERGKAHINKRLCFGSLFPEEDNGGVNNQILNLIGMLKSHSLTILFFFLWFARETEGDSLHKNAEVAV